MLVGVQKYQNMSDDIYSITVKKGFGYIERWRKKMLQKQDLTSIIFEKFNQLTGNFRPRSIQSK